MSYTPIYTSVADVQKLLQFTIDSNSKPDNATVTGYIKEVETRICDRKLGAHNVTDQYIDVYGGDSGVDVSEYLFSSSTGRFDFGLSGGYIIPLADIKNPVITITSLYKNEQDYTAAPSWEALQQWDGTNAGADFMLLTSGKRTTGYALYFFNEYPPIGPKRLKMTFTYGYNINATILGEWATLAAGIKTLTARMGTNSPSGISGMNTGNLGSFLTTNYNDRIAQYRYEMAKIEFEHFPNLEENNDVAVAVLC